MAKVIIYLREHQASALNNFAQREYRLPKAQAALIIRKELERLGMSSVEHEQQLQITDTSAVRDTERAS